MIGLNEINESLNTNIYLTPELKSNILELVEVLKQKLPDVNLSVLNDRLKTLQVKKGSKFLITRSSSYNILENTIYFNQTKFEDYDYKFILMKMLLHIATAKDKFSGFNVDNKYEALNLGYTEKLANFLVGNEALPEYEDELVVVSSLTLIAGEDAFFNAYFSNDINPILNVIG